jgi:hypothetical protein
MQQRAPSAPDAYERIDVFSSVVPCSPASDCSSAPDSSSAL